jgi:hypothetical protein
MTDQWSLNSDKYTPIGCGEEGVTEKTRSAALFLRFRL